MSDYELLSLVLAISMLVIAIVALCSNAKKQAALNHASGLINLIFEDNRLSVMPLYSLILSP